MLLLITTGPRFHCLQLCFVLQPQEELHPLFPEVLPSGHHVKPFPSQTATSSRQCVADFTRGLGHYITAYYRKPQRGKRVPFLKVP